MYRQADKNLLRIAEEMIDLYHPDLKESSIGFLYKKKAPVSGGMVTLGKAKKVSDDMRVFVDYDFVVWVAADMWAGLNEEQKKALVDHELCHCAWDNEEEKATMRKHDFEEFNEIIERWGFWRPHSTQTVEAVQSSLFKIETSSDTFRKKGVYAVEVEVNGKKSDALTKLMSDEVLGN